ncbi:OBAP family protein [Pseudenterobacter timonensis]|uniref:OBAP family protein n=1 Tax=Pseudenterobacter timonensis TaxID=1755099 RepID=A0AAE4IYN4_9ENTR|nr:OBAP family protein [Pseudenterobacter timonensis]MDR9892421.1 OBAP family protein [Pseudenterobacter timonensis]
MKSLPLMTLLSLVLTGCGANNTPPQAPIPGAKTSAELRTLETGAQVIQSRPPVDAISAYLDGFHFYSGDKNGQMEAHHYVTVLNEDVMQAVIYDGNTKDARLMGVEYIISERLFNTLPPEEKKLWHSHQYEVKSGSLVAPGLPAVADKALMTKIVNTYGKTWHTWHTDRDKTLPLGIPALMMGFTGEGQLDPALLADRDRRLDIDTQAIKRQRADIVAHPVAEGVNAWEKGEVIQLKRVQGSGEQGHGETSHFGTSEQTKRAQEAGKTPKM